MTRLWHSVCCSVLALSACKGDAPKKQEPVPEPTPAPTAPAPTPPAKPEKPAVSPLNCDVIFPVAERDKIIPKAYESPGSKPGRCEFEVAIDKATPKFYIEATCGAASDDDAAIDKRIEQWEAARGKAILVDHVGRRAYRGSKDNDRWAMGWDDDSSCVVEVTFLPEPFNPVDVLTIVLRNIKATK